MLSLLGNLTIASAKFYGYSRTGHSAMFTEAVHTLVDVGNQVLAQCCVDGSLWVCGCES